MTNTFASDWSDWQAVHKQEPSLPGQLDLFTEPTVGTSGSARELFDTGRGLPGAGERAQQILWDIDPLDD